MDETGAHYTEWSKPERYSEFFDSGFPGGSDGKEPIKNPSAVGETGFNPWVGKIPWMQAWQSTPVFLPGEAPWTEEPGELQSTGLQRVGQNWVTKDTMLLCLCSLSVDWGY